MKSTIGPSGAKGIDLNLPRTYSHIIGDLRMRNFVPIGNCVNVFQGISPNKYAALMGVLAEIGNHHPPFVGLRLPNPDVIENTSFEKIPARYFDQYVKKQTLDLRDFEKIVREVNRRIATDNQWATSGERDDIPEMLDMFGLEGEYFDKLLASPDLSVAKAFNSLRHALIDNHRVPYSAVEIHTDPESMRNILAKPRADSHSLIKLETFRGLEAVVELIDATGELPSDPIERQRIEKGIAIYFRMFCRVLERARAMEMVSSPPVIALADPMASPKREPVSAEKLEADFFELAQRKSPMKYFGENIAVGAIMNPSSSLTDDEQTLTIDALNFVGRSRADMVEHLIRVAEVEVVFYKRRPIAFGAGNEIYFQNNGNSERLEYLVATMVRAGSYGKGLQTVVNGLFLLKRWRPFSSMFVVMRTSAVGAISGFLKYFSKVVFTGLNVKQFRRATEFSRFMGCRVDEEGIVRNAYAQPPQDVKRDKEILANIIKKNTKEAERIVSALDDLQPKDARIFQGELTIIKAFKIWFYINVVFRYKNWKSERTGKNFLGNYTF